MSAPLTLAPPSSPVAGRAAFVASALAACAAAALAGWAPLRFSIVTVFLFAGPHNWLEFRYFLTRLPARWGRLRPFFLLAFAGMIGLTAAFAAFGAFGSTSYLAGEAWLYAYSLLNTA